MAEIKSTYKSLDTEETLDILLYRPIGYGIAIVSKNIGIIPNTITLIGTIAGVIAGHLFYYNNLTANIIGILLLMISQAMDSADGQLARITGRFSRLGRILDGFATNLIFLSIYLHLCFRLINEGYSVVVFGIMILAGISHSLQSAMADYYRNGYIRFAVPEKKSELDFSEEIAKKHWLLSWKTNFFEKFFSRIYLNYTLEQEMLSPNFKILIRRVKEAYGDNIPDEERQFYKAKCKPMMKYCNILTTNTRMIFLFVVLLAGKLTWYFAFEIFALNALLLYVVLYQEKVSTQLLRAMQDRKAAV